MPAAAGLTFLGAGVVITAAACLAGAGVAQTILRWRRGATAAGAASAATTANSAAPGLTAFLCALTLPPTALPIAAAACGALAALAGRLVRDAGGRSRWNPAAVACVAAQCLFGAALGLGDRAAAPAVLDRAHLVFGDAANAVEIDLAHGDGWRDAAVSMTTQAVQMPRPVGVLRQLADGRVPPRGGAPLLTALRDGLPPWDETLLGAVPAASGTGAAAALIVSILVLAYRGELRWTLALGAVGAAFVAAAVLPLQTGPGGAYAWFPGWASWNGSPIGLIYVLYHLTCGQLLLGILVAAADPTSLPASARGQFIFGVGLGAGTIFMRLYGPLEAEALWPIIFMNTLARRLDKSSASAAPSSQAVA